MLVTLGVQHVIAAVYSDKNDAKLGENGNWRSDVTAKEALEQRLYQAGFGEDANTAEVFTLLDSCEGDRVFDIGVRDRLVPLRRWSSSSGRVVLLGDAAHAMYVYDKEMR